MGGALLKSCELLACGLLMLLAGCKRGVGESVYMPAPPKHDPTVQIVDFTYRPTLPRLGDTLTFTASTSKPFEDWYGSIKVEIGNGSSALMNDATPHLQVKLNDYGWDGDQTAGDGLWGGELDWLPGYGTQQDLPVAAHLVWGDGYVSDPVFATPLTVIEAEE